MTTPIDERLKALEAQLGSYERAIEQHRTELDRAQQAAEILRARIEGIKEGLAAMQEPQAPLPRRRPRRDIKGMVAEILRRSDKCPTPEEVAEEIGCRVSQVRAALRPPKVGMN